VLGADRRPRRRYLPVVEPRWSWLGVKPHGVLASPKAGSELPGIRGQSRCRVAPPQLIMGPRPIPTGPGQGVEEGKAQVKG
jgi:hypothetical protein